MPASNMDIFRELQAALIEQKKRAERLEKQLIAAVDEIADLHQQNGELQRQNAELRSVNANNTDS